MVAGEAEALVRSGRAGGFLEIPEGLERDVKRGAPATVGAFADATYFLVYRQVLTGLAEATGTLSAGVEIRRLEAQGLPEEYEADCDTLVKMPMMGKADSLNAAVAASVMAYEVLNQSRHR